MVVGGGDKREYSSRRSIVVIQAPDPTIESNDTVPRLCRRIDFYLFFNLVMDMGHARERGIGQIITNIYSLIGRQKEIEQSIFIKHHNDFANALFDTGRSRNMPSNQRSPSLCGNVLLLQDYIPIF